LNPPPFADIDYLQRRCGAVTPPEVLGHLLAAILKMQETERLVLEPACGEGFDH